MSVRTLGKIGQKEGNSGFKKKNLNHCRFITSSYYLVIENAPEGQRLDMLTDNELTVPSVLQ